MIDEDEPYPTAIRCCECGELYSVVLPVGGPWHCRRCIRLAAVPDAPAVAVPVAPDVAPGLCGLVALLVLLQACIPPQWPCPGCPTPAATATATRTATPEATRTPRPVEPFQATEGAATFELDLTGFTPRPDGLDYYAAATLLWTNPPTGRDLPTTPALELSIRGTSTERCLASPCGPSSLGLVARWSANVRHDSQTPEERDHCGRGIGYSQRLPIGPGQLVSGRVEWRAGQVRVSTPLGSWATTKGASAPGFGLVFMPLPRSGGIGWARSPWTLQEWGGRVRLVEWQGVSGTGVGMCP